MYIRGALELLKMVFTRRCRLSLLDSEGLAKLVVSSIYKGTSPV